MEENVGRLRLGRESRAHASARVVNPTRSKRGRRRQSPVPFQGRHDDEAGASDAVSSQRRRRVSQDQVEAEAPEVEDEVQDDAPDGELEMTAMMLYMHHLMEGMVVDRPI
ncbi:hypothetical protein QL285_014120 [Trifolium repens]|nr:hypothetical protein QL285_014120 [Trifolium repens]